jgi:hypothetical protein
MFTCLTSIAGGNVAVGVAVGFFGFAVGTISGVADATSLTATVGSTVLVGTAGAVDCSQPCKNMAKSMINEKTFFIFISSFLNENLDSHDR